MPQELLPGPDPWTPPDMSRRRRSASPAQTPKEPRVELWLSVRIHDRQALLDYTLANANIWGLDRDAFLGDDDQTLALAVREALLCNTPPGGPEAIGLEIVDDDYHLASPAEQARRTAS